MERSYKTSKIKFKSKKLSKYKINERILYNNEKIIFTNDIGDIVFYSFKEEKITFKYNFYKKKFKNVKKKLNLTIDNNILYINDNLGYIYALDYNQKKYCGQKISKFLLGLI